MEIDDTPPGLTARRAIWIGIGRVLIQEDWDLDVPGCPMIRSPYHEVPDGAGSKYMREIEMSEREFKNVNPKLFSAA